MKKFKRIASAVAALVMAATLTVPMSAMFTASAVDYSIVISDDTAGYTYDAYQIFEGTPGTRDVELTVSGWGTGFDGSTHKDEIEEIFGELSDWSDADGGALAVANALTTATAEKLQKFMKLVLANPSDIAASADGVTDNKGYVIDLTDPGYYLVNNSTAPDNEAYSSYIVKVVKGEAAADPKVARPTVDKQVEDNDTTEGTGSEQSTNQHPGQAADDSKYYFESADHALYESFNFKLTATLPASEAYNSYDEYAITFSDTMSKGIAFEKIESIKINGAGESYDLSLSGTDNLGNYGITLSGATDIDGTADEAKSWTLAFADLKDTAFGALDLTAGATIEVIYSAHLTEKAVGNNQTGTINNDNVVSLTYSNNPNADGTGTTTSDKVYVTTYEFIAAKYYDHEDDDNYMMNGAKFKLFADQDEKTEIKLVWDETAEVYRPKKTDSEETYAEYLVSGGNDKADVEGDAYKGTNTVEEGTGWTNNDGLIKIVGLDAGTYYLQEMEAPAGYNIVETPIEFNIVAEHKENIDENSGLVTISDGSTIKHGILATVITDYKGTTLPETGGIGTTLFYVVGGALVTVAGVTLITKKRVGDAE